jgi:hypothetical protein
MINTEDAMKYQQSAHIMDILHAASPGISLRVDIDLILAIRYLSLHQYAYNLCIVTPRTTQEKRLS